MTATQKAPNHPLIASDRIVGFPWQASRFYKNNGRTVHTELYLVPKTPS
jgi:hypothetical protein